jgi:DNA-binding transcriptional LysR family regulator
MKGSWVVDGAFMPPSALDNKPPTPQHWAANLQPLIMRFDWNDLRFLAAVLEHGSTARAARAIGVDQTTCARRIAALEAALDLTLFTRDGTGYHPTPAALVLQPAAMAVAAEVEHFANQVDAAARHASRRIRITCEEHVANRLVVPALAQFGLEHPQVQVELDASAAFRDLQAGEADIAIRAGAPPEEPSLILRKLRDDPWGVYCSRAYAARQGAPETLADLARHPLVSLEAALDGIRAAGLAGAVRQVVTSMPSLQAAVLTGGYVGALPQIVAEGSEDLQFCFGVPTISTLWLIYPERLRNAPEVRALTGFLVKALRAPSRADGAPA